jgi:hypothetical protein
MPRAKKHTQIEAPAWRLWAGTGEAGKGESKRKGSRDAYATHGGEKRQRKAAGIRGDAMPLSCPMSLSPVLRDSGTADKESKVDVPPERYSLAALALPCWGSTRFSSSIRAMARASNRWAFAGVAFLLRFNCLRNELLEPGQSQSPRVDSLKLLEISSGVLCFCHLSRHGGGLFPRFAILGYGPWNAPNSGCHGSRP